MKKVESIGLFGGTFSPPHNGHVRAVKIMLKSVPMNILYIMPAGIPPHKAVENDVSACLRLEMARAAFEPIDSRICVSDYEISKPGASYTSETLKYLKTQHPDACVYLFCGTDMFLTLEDWHDSDYIFSSAHIVCIMRDDRKFEVIKAAQRYRSNFNADVDVIPEPSVKVSSSEIRHAFSKDADLSQFVPSGVLKIIEREGLYR